MTAGAAVIAPRRARIALAIYLLIPALLVLGPLPVRLLDVTVDTVVRLLRLLGDDDLSVSRQEVEAACNVAMFVPIALLLVLGWPRLSALGAVALCAAASGAVELTQGALLSGRYATPRDVALNTAGAAVGALVAAGLRRRGRD